MKVCIVNGCPTLTTGTRCTIHARATDRARGSRQARGYTTAHDQQRARWAPIVATGTTDCHATICLEPTRRIHPGQPWDLDHTDDRTSYRGPTHARCNRAAGGRASHH